MALPLPTPPDEKGKKKASTISPPGRATGSTQARTNIPVASPQKIPHSRSISLSSNSHSARSSPAASPAKTRGRQPTPRRPNSAPRPSNMSSSSNDSGRAPSPSRAGSTHSGFGVFSTSSGRAASSNLEGSPFSQGQETPSNASSATLVHVPTGSSTGSFQTSIFRIRRNQEPSPRPDDLGRTGLRAEAPLRSTNTAAFEENDKHADYKRYKRGRSGIP